MREHCNIFIWQVALNIWSTWNNHIIWKMFKLKLYITVKDTLSLIHVKKPLLQTHIPSFLSVSFTVIRFLKCKHSSYFFITLCKLNSGIAGSYNSSVFYFLNKFVFPMMAVSTVCKSSLFCTSLSALIFQSFWIV